MSVDSSLLSHISKFPKGTVFFAEDLECTGYSPEDIRFSLSRIVSDQTGIMRLARGVYCVPRVDPDSGKYLPPSVEVVAENLARRWKVRIAPCGAQSCYLAGFTRIQTHQYTWVSDGSEQVFHLQNGVTVRFVRRKSVKVFQFRSERMRNLVEALRYLGEEGIGSEERGVIGDNLLHVSDGDFSHDVRLAPLWIRLLLSDIR